MTVQSQQQSQAIPVLSSQNGTEPQDANKEVVQNVAAKGVQYFNPEQLPAPGLGINGPNNTLPKVFTPIKIRGMTMPNRIWQPWHFAHYGGLAQRGPGLIMLEATAVQARGRITPEDSGIWLDSHVEGLRKHVEFAHSNNSLIGIQIGHAGRKASCVAPWRTLFPVFVERLKQDLTLSTSISLTVILFPASCPLPPTSVPTSTEVASRTECALLSRLSRLHELLCLRTCPCSLASVELTGWRTTLSTRERPGLLSRASSLHTS
ncbi:unnamed protein product [Fusarium graminearum]|nr:unnamed protein product [Fusarium graminearum]